MAANLDEAIADVAVDFFTNITTNALLRTGIGNWNVIFSLDTTIFPAPGTPFDRLNPNHYMITDWQVPMLNLLDQTPNNATAISPFLMNRGIDVVARTLWTARQDQAAGRITANQVTSIVTAYTSAWE